eukprot:COSAG02_NODE_36444_length_454_cov_1.160563_1_plen_33_part_10
MPSSTVAHGSLGDRIDLALAGDFTDLREIQTVL